MVKNIKPMKTREEINIIAKSKGHTYAAEKDMFFQGYNACQKEYESKIDKDLNERLGIIKAICERHPASGVNAGWSRYTGGFTDSGYWFVRKMLDAPIEQLENFLGQMIEEESRPSIVLTEQEKLDSQTIVELPGGGWITEYARKGLANLRNESEMRLIYGPDYKK